MYSYQIIIDFLLQITCEGEEHFRACRSNFHATEEFSFLKDTTSNVNFITLLCQESYIRGKTRKRSMTEATSKTTKRPQTGSLDLSGTSDYADDENVGPPEDLSSNFTGNLSV